MFDVQRSQAAFRVAWAAAARTSLAVAAVAVPVLSWQWFEQLASTNQTLWHLLEQGSAPGTVVIAGQQQAGRGQWGRQWISHPGGLYLSIGLAIEQPIAQNAELTLAIAWGVATALREIPAQLSGVSEGIPVALKWPNDLVVGGHKLGGILTETRLQQGQVMTAVVGVGLNWTNPVPETGVNLQTLLADRDEPLIESLEMLAAITLVGIVAAYQRWQHRGIQVLLPNYQALLTNLGQSVTVNGRVGTIVGVLPTGELRVQLQRSGESDPSAEVFLKPGTINLGYGEARSLERS